MEKILFSSAIATFSLIGREIFKLYKLNNFSHLIKTSMQLDTSYEKITKDLKNKNVLIASSISKIIKLDNNTSSENITKIDSINKTKELKTLVLKSVFMEPEVLKELYFNFRFPDKNNLIQIYVSNFNEGGRGSPGNEIDNIELKFKNNESYVYLDGTNLKPIVIQENDKINNDNYKRLSIIEKIRLFPIKNLER